MPMLDDGDVVLHLGDCVEVMAAMPPESIDAIVCDPPYGLEFMGREWDSFRVDDRNVRGYNGRETGKAGEIAERDGATLGGRLRVGYGGGSRAKTSRCEGCGKRDQFRKPHACPEGTNWRSEIIDPHAAPPSMLAFQEWCRTWSTEALRVLKPGGHMLAFGGTRTFHRLTCAIEDAGFEIRDCMSWLYGSGFPKSLDVSKAIDKAAGAEREVVGPGRYAGRESSTDLGVMNDDAWEGGAPRTLTAPATPEAAKWQGWGTALKPAWEPIVVARKPLGGTVAANVLRHGTGALNIDGCRVGTQGGTRGEGHPGTGLLGIGGNAKITQLDAGRWPANVVLDEAAAERLDADVGERTSPATYTRSARAEGSWLHAKEAGTEQAGYGDTGGPSRFFYTAKASTAERDGATHPTVKPLALMRWCVRLVTPPGGVVLDCFAGSGTTLLAARDEGFRAIGIERDEEYARMILERYRRRFDPSAASWDTGERGDDDSQLSLLA